MKIYFTSPKIVRNIGGSNLESPDVPDFNQITKLRCADYETGMVAGAIAPDAACANILAAPGVTERTEEFAVAILGGPV